MKLHWEPITLELRTTFRVAHGASDQRHNVLVYTEHGHFLRFLTAKTAKFAKVFKRFS